MASVEDVNGDGRDDLVVHMETRDLQLDADATEALLTARLSDGKLLAGTDSVRIVK